MKVVLNNIVAAGVNPSIAASWTNKINESCERYDILTALRIAHFLAQIAHESNGLTSVIENLNYSAQRLLQVFPKYFSTEDLALAYAHNPEKIANRIYANRMGNGDEISGDGWKYRGRGFIQLTGRDNYKRYGHEDDPDSIDPADSAGWFWNSHNLNSIADTDDIIAITKIINGGTMGINDRKTRLAHVKASLGIVNNQTQTT